MSHTGYFGGGGESQSVERGGAESVTDKACVCVFVLLPACLLFHPCRCLQSAGSSLLLYAGVGFFGAALFGANTQSNIMLNALCSNPWGTLAMNGAMLFYLAAGAAACQYPLRTSIDMLLVGEHVPMTVPRAVSWLRGAFVVVALVCMSWVQDNMGVCDVGAWWFACGACKTVTVSDAHV